MQIVQHHDSLGRDIIFIPAPVPAVQIGMAAFRQIFLYKGGLAVAGCPIDIGGLVNAFRGF